MKKKKTFNYTFDLQKSPQVHSMEQLVDTALNLHQKGNLLKAEQLYRRILQLQPAHDYVSNLLGVLLSQKGLHQEGEKLIARAIGIDSSVADYHNNLGLTLQHQGKMEEAAQSFRQAVQLNPGFTNAWLCLGNVSMLLEGPQTAIDAFQKVISIDPKFLPAYNNLGNLYSKINQFDRAHHILDKVVKLQPDFAEGWYNIGVVYMAEKKGAEAIAAFDRAIQLKPGYFKAWSKRGHCRNALLNDRKGAMRDFDQAIALNPSYIQAYLSRAGIYQKAGELEQAEMTLIKLLTAMDNAGRELDHKEGEFSKRHQSDNYLYDLGSVHFMVGDILDQQGDYSRAFTHYQKANSIHGAMVTYDRQAHEQLIDALISVFTPDFFSEFSDLGTADELPLILTGLSRGGKTVTEENITRHPQVTAGGELSFFTRASQERKFFFATVEPWPFCCRALSQSSAQRLIAKYLELLRGFPDARFVTDTSPGNYLFLGLIRVLFPKAPLIHCCRDPLDLCLSIYFKGYKNINYYRYSYDLMNIGHYYLQYARLMAHWRKVLPGPPIVESRYEELTGNFEAHGRRLLQCCGLDLDTSGVGSSLQIPGDDGVRYGHDQQPIHNSYVHFSKHYEEFLEPLKEMIASASIEE